VVFQAFNLIPSLSATDNVRVALQVAGVSRREARERATALIERVGLTDRAGNKPNEMSGGQQQRVAIARALAQNPPVILADEPTAHLDFVQCEVVLRILRELTAEGRTVVIATHDDRLLPLADRVVELTPRFVVEDRTGDRVTVAAGETLFRQGDPSDHVYLVAEGTIEVLQERSDGSTDLLTVLEPGRYLGELGPLLGLPRSATARARTDCTLEIQSPQQFRARMGQVSLGDRVESAG
jgi:putative ABC transport system ATP-binding protein